MYFSLYLLTESFLQTNCSIHFPMCQNVLTIRKDFLKPSIDSQYLGYVLNDHFKRGIIFHD